MKKSKYVCCILMILLLISFCTIVNAATTTTHKHSYTWKTTKAATCTVAGQEKKMCSCGSFIDVRTVKALGHSYYWSMTSATCTKTGSKTQICRRCGVKGKTETLAKLEHNYSAATCISPAKCKYCGATSGSALGHKYGAYVVENATYHARTCSVCKNKQQAKHNIVNGQCTICYYKASTSGTKNCTHGNWTDWTITKVATCTLAGAKKRTCRKCDYVEFQTIPATGHNYKAATCTSPKTCTKCGATSGSALGHKYGAYVVDNATYHARTCSVCKNKQQAKHNMVNGQCTVCYYKASTSGTKNCTHGNWTDWIITKEATCTASGIKKRTCRKCDYVEFQAILATGHSYKAATCTSPKTCTKCGITSGSALGHDFPFLAPESKYTKDSNYHYILCSRGCGTKQKEKHEYYNNGTTEKCIVCGFVKCKHDWTPWLVTKEATCKAKGTEKRICKICQTIETRSINKLEHDYPLTTSIENRAVNYHYLVCKNCGNKKKENHNFYLGYHNGEVCMVCGYNKMVGTCQHDYKYVVTKAPTCTKVGKETGTCSKCLSKTTRDIPPTQHNWTEWTVTREATCKTNGIQKRTCRKCDKRETQIIEKLEHNYSSTYEYNKSNHYRKCTNEGCTQRLVQRHQFVGNICSICGYDESLKQKNKPDSGKNIKPSVETPPAVETPPSVEIPPIIETPTIENLPTNENLTSGEKLPIEENPINSEFPSYEINGYIISQNTSAKFDETFELPRLNKKELEMIINKWLDERFSNDKAKAIKKDILNDDTIKDIIKIQNDYNVSSIFLLAVATQETSMNTNNKFKNLFNIYDDSNISGDNKLTLKKYNSYSESFEDFAKILAETEHYFLSGNITVEKIGNIYVTSDISKEWITNVINITAEIMNYYEPIEEKSIYNDVSPDDWYYDAVEYTVEKELFDGIIEENFEPNKNMTRGLLVTALYRLSGTETNKKATFDDVDEDAYYSNAIYWATKKGIVNGIGDNKFAPDREITREDLATIIERYMDKMKIKISNNKNAKTDFEDIDEISEYAKEHVETVAKKGLMQGKNDNYFDPKGKATRAEVATILMRLDK